MNGRWIAFALALAAAPLASRAQDQLRTQDRGTVPQHDLTPDQDRIRLELRDEIVADGSAAKADLAALDPEIASYVKANGEAEQLRNAARESAGGGCKGACLRETFRHMNAEMSRGATAAQARARAVAAVQERARSGSGSAGAGETKRVREQGRDRARDRTMERTQTREPAGKGGPR